MVYNSVATFLMNLGFCTQHQAVTDTIGIQSALVANGFTQVEATMLVAAMKTLAATAPASTGWSTVANSSPTTKQNIGPVAGGTATSAPKAWSPVQNMARRPI